MNTHTQERLAHKSLPAKPAHDQLSVFTARCYASAVLAMGLCLSVSVTSRSSTKTAKRRITKTKQHDSSGSLVS